MLGVSGQEEEGNTVGAIPGQAGRDYPNFQVRMITLRFRFVSIHDLLEKEIPESSFSCRDLSPGFYADPEGECQVVKVSQAKSHKM